MMHNYGPALNPDFFAGKVDDVAMRTIGCFVFTVVEGLRVGGMIVETEAYDENDSAAHCHPQASRRRYNGSSAMRMLGGFAYVYPSRGMWCLNFVCDKEGYGSAVLIRALEPVCGLETMRERRAPFCEAVRDNRMSWQKYLCNGPSALAEALAVTDHQNKKSLFSAPFQLFDRTEEPKILSGPRVGVTSAKDYQRRYALFGSQFISKPNSAKYPLALIAEPQLCAD